MASSNNAASQFGDTTLTKVFVGGLAWETPKEALRDHFHKYGEIFEAVIICDKLTGRSKGYGFVTFKEAEAAKKACEDAAPIINGRRANCNLASLGARRPRPAYTVSAPPLDSPHQGLKAGTARSMSPAPVNQMQWYYPVGTGAPPHATAYHQHHHGVPYYGFSPAPTTYIATDMSYNNHKLSYMYPSQTALMPVYHPFYHHSPTVGLPAHIFPTGGPISSAPAILSKPPPPPNSVCLAVE